MLILVIGFVFLFFCTFALVFKTFIMNEFPPKNYLVEAILITIFCCQPFGIVSIVFASQVNSKFEAGDFNGAIKASEDARKWTKWGFITGLVFFSLFLLVYGIIFALAITQGDFLNEF